MGVTGTCARTNALRALLAYREPIAGANLSSRVAAAPTVAEVAAALPRPTVLHSTPKSGRQWCFSLAVHECCLQATAAFQPGPRQQQPGVVPALLEVSPTV